MKYLPAALAVTLATSSSTNAQEYIDMSAFGQIKQGVQSTYNPKASTPAQTTSQIDIRKQYCLDNLSTSSLYIDRFASNAKILRYGAAAHLRDQAKTERMIRQGAKNFKSYRRLCESSSASFNKTRKTFEDFVGVVEALGDRIGTTDYE